MSRPTGIKDLIHNNLSIPTIPEVVARIASLIEDPETGAAQIGALIAQDAPMAAKVLRIANSAYYGLATECVSTEHASTVLGVRVLKNIVTQIAVMDKYEHLKGSSEFDVQQLWKHSIHTANTCSALAKRSRTVKVLTPDELYVCGLLHDVGKVVMLDSLGGGYLEVACRSRSENLPFHVLEQQALGFDHTDVGALVAARWGLPEAISQAIQYHHQPEAGNPAFRPVIETVARVNEVVHCFEEGNPAAAESILSGESATVLGLGPADVAFVLERAAEAPEGF